MYSPFRTKILFTFFHPIQNHEEQKHETIYSEVIFYVSEK